MARVLLLNPPSHKICMRDYFCSKVSKGAYCYHPVDFVVLSGILSEQHQVDLVDAIAEHFDQRRTLAAITQKSPDVVIFLTGAVSFEEDGPFLSEVKRLTRARMIGIGDVFLELPEEFFGRWDWLDAVLLDFSTKDILNLIGGQPREMKNSVVRMADGVVKSFPISYEEGEWDIPLPRHEMFMSLKYSFPFARQTRFATVLTNFGCPYACEYCPVSRFPYKERSLDRLQLEFDLLRQLGVKEVVFKDQTFGVRRERIAAICKALLDRKVPFGWTCFLRPELADGSILELMVSAGCHTVIFGVESGDGDVRRRYHREYSDQYLKDVFLKCRSLGIETVATFVMGLPGETLASLEKTIVLAKALRCDYASFNIFVPAYGTFLRRCLIRGGVVKEGLDYMDSGVSYPFLSTDSLKASDLWMMRNRALWEFYGRIGFLMEKIVKAGSLSRLAGCLCEGWAVMIRRSG